MLKVKAIWRVGYPPGSGKKIYSGGDVFKCDDEWGKRKAEQGKVEIIERIEEEPETIEDKLSEYDQGYGWYKLPGVDRNVRKKEALGILKEM